MTRNVWDPGPDPRPALAHYQTGDLVICVVDGKLQTGVIWSTVNRGYYQIDLATSPHRIGMSAESIAPLDPQNVDRKVTPGRRLFGLQVRALSAAGVT